MTNSHDDYAGTDPVARFAAKVTSQVSEIDAATVQEAMRALHRYLRSRFPSLRAEDLEDLVGEAVTRVMAKSQTGSLRQHQNPAGYLVRTAENVALDYLRSARHNREVSVSGEQLMDYQLTDAQTATTLDSRATVELVHAVLRRIQSYEDDTLVQIATHLLDEIQRTGSVPSNRQIAEACGCSHTTVANALRRLRDHITALSDAT